MHFLRKLWGGLLSSLRSQDPLLSSLVFLSIFLSWQLSHYIFFGLTSSPAVIAPVAGIAVGALLVGGYRMWIPIALGYWLSALSGTTSANLFFITIGTFAITFQSVIITYVLKLVGFNGAFARLRDTWTLLLVVFFGSMIGPFISVGLASLSHPLSQPFLTLWSAGWAGYILSGLIFIPLITTWLPFLRTRLAPVQYLEVALAFASLIGVSMYLFWISPTEQWLSVTLIYAFLGVLAWISLRLRPRSMAMALLFALILGVIGAMLFPHPGKTIADRLFSIELFLELVAVIFLAFSSLIEERRRVRADLEDTVGKLHMSMAEMEKADKAKNEFIAVLAHELRNPLAPIMSTLELLRFRESDKESLTLIENAEGQTHLMRRLLDDLLDVARVTQQKFHLRKEVIDAETLIRRSLVSVAVIAESKNLAVTSTLPSEKIALFVDPIRFEQVLTNLLNNAVKYTERGGKIHVSAEVKDRTFILTVSDTGVGIAASDLTNVFLPFRQVQEQTPRRGTGLGIGLSLTKRLVEMHNGAIEAASPGLGKGSTFTVRLPLYSGAPGSSTAESITTRSHQHVMTHSILIVDDNRPAAEGLSRLLVLKGHQVTTAFSGAEALEKAAEVHPDIVLLDIGLPDIDGYEVAKRLRAAEMGRKPSFIVALTGYGQEDDKHAAHAAGFDRHLTKPARIAEIETVIGQMK